MVSTRTIINAIIGAIAAVLLSFLPLSTGLGGAVAGFLEGPDRKQGSIVGAISGAIMFLPFAGLSLLLLGVLGFGIGLAAFPVESVFFVFVLVVGSILVLGYTVGLALVGGYVGSYVASEYPNHHASAASTLGYDPQTMPPTTDDQTMPPTTDDQTMPPTTEDQTTPTTTERHDQSTDIDSREP